MTRTASLGPTLYPVERAHSPVLMVREGGLPAPAQPRLLDRVREAIRARHYSRRTEKAYIHWVKRYILFHGKRHPVEMGAPEATKFLTALAVDIGVAASTQNQAPAGIHDSRGAGYPGQLIGLRAPEPVEKMRQNPDETCGVRTVISGTTPRVLPAYPDPHMPGSNSRSARNANYSGSKYYRELGGRHMRNEFTAVVERAGRWHIAYCPEIPGANGQGRTKAAALNSLSKAIALILEDRRKDGLCGVPASARREKVIVG